MFVACKFKEEKMCLLCEGTIAVGDKGIQAKHGCVCEPCIKKEGGLERAVIKLFGIKEGAFKDGEWEFTDVRLDQAWGSWKSEDSRGNQGGYTFRWAAKGIGFGEIVFAKQNDGSITCDNETMPKWFIIMAFAHFLDSVTMSD